MKRIYSLFFISVIVSFSVFLSLSYAATFSDVDEGDSYYTAIEFLVAQDTIEGYSDGSFGVENTINRAELMKILVVGQGIELDEDEYNNLLCKRVF